MIARIACAGVCFVVCSANSCNKDNPIETDCGNGHTAGYYATLSTHNPNYYAQTGDTASSTCPVQYYLDFHWADPVRAKTDTFAPPPLGGLTYAFHVDSLNLYFTHPAPYKKTVFDVPNDWPEWEISCYDHYSGSKSATSNYFISTADTSVNPADSISVVGTMQYHVLPEIY